MDNRSSLALLSFVVLMVGVTGTPAVAGPAVDRVAGESCAKPIGVTIDADGDEHHRFRHANGMIEDHIVAGADFAPGTASPARLGKFALSPRPEVGATDRAEWDAVAANVKKHVRPHQGCIMDGVRAYPVNHNLNYSGYKAVAASGKAYSGAHSSYTAPSYFLSTCVNESMTQWVGVSNDQVLVQSGLYVNQYSGTVQAGGFYEFVGGPWETPGLVSMASAVPYHAGHRYFFKVLYLDRYHWQVLVNNLDNGDLFDITVFNPNAGGTNYIQPFAYFISERLYVGGNLTQYMNHSGVRFRTATAHIYGEVDARLSIQRPEQMIMHSPGLSGPRLGNLDPLEVEASNFTEYWARCGVVEFVG